MAWGFGVVLGLMQLALRTGFGRRWIAAWAPAPGEGPSEAEMDAGGFRCDLVGRSDGGRTLRGRVATKGDPGNRATTLFACEAALALVRDAARLPGDGGVLTPSVAFGDVLVQRLRAQGVAFDVLDR